MSLDYQFSGPPANVEAPSEGLGLGADNFNNTLWLISNAGYIPVSGGVVDKVAKLSQTANIANLLTYTVAANGLYEINGYIVQATSTSGTAPSMTAVWTEFDNTGSITTTVVTGGSSSAANTVFEGRYIVNVGAGTTIVLATTSYATLTYNVKARISYLG